jgi:hypothetical protein
MESIEDIRRLDANAIYEHRVKIVKQIHELQYEIAALKAKYYWYTEQEEAFRPFINGQPPVKEFYF